MEHKPSLALAKCAKRRQTFGITLLPDGNGGFRVTGTIKLESRFYPNLQKSCELSNIDWSNYPGCPYCSNGIKMILKCGNCGTLFCFDRMAKVGDKVPTTYCPNCGISFDHIGSHFNSVKAGKPGK